MESKKTSGEIDYQAMGYDKARQHFGWTPKISLEEGLNLTIDWFSKYLENSNSQKSGRI